MTIALASAIHALRLGVIATALDGGTLTLYSGARPAFGTTAGLTPQAVIPLASPAATVSGNVLTFPTLDGMRTDSATISWARFADASGAPVADLDVSSTSAGTGDVFLDNVNGSIGGFVTITVGTLTDL